MTSKKLLYYIIVLYFPCIFSIKIINNLSEDIVNIYFRDGNEIELGPLQTYEYELEEFGLQVFKKNCFIKVNPQDEQVIIQTLDDRLLIIKKVNDKFEFLRLNHLSDYYVYL